MIQPFQDPMHRIRCVLVGTTHPGNIGATARALKGMGLRQMALVAPKLFPCAEATARASGADDLLASATLHPDLTGAIADCTLTIGSSARRRTVAWPELTPAEAAMQLYQAAQHGPVALIFGRERTGLTNEELDQCQYLTRIPSVDDFSSLNLAAAVQLYAYELRKCALADVQQIESPPRLPVNALEFASFMDHWQRVLLAIGYAEPERSERLLRRLRRLFHRATLDRDEINLLRGALSAVENLMKSNGKPDV